MWINFSCGPYTSRSVIVSDQHSFTLPPHALLTRAWHFSHPIALCKFAFKGFHEQGCAGMPCFLTVRSRRHSDPSGLYREQDGHAGTRLQLCRSVARPDKELRSQSPLLHHTNGAQCHSFSTQLHPKPRHTEAPSGFRIASTTRCQKLPQRNAHLVALKSSQTLRCQPMKPRPLPSLPRALPQTSREP